MSTLTSSVKTSSKETKGNPLSQEYSKYLLDIREQLDHYVIGQSEAKDEIIEALSRSLIVNPRRKKPIASLFFVGPTGVGKTEVVRALFKILFGDDEDIKKTKIDCANYGEDHQVLDLIGSPASYVGYGDLPRLSDVNIFSAYKKAKSKGNLHPMIARFEDFGILLLDEFEKSSPRLKDILLSIMDEGVLELSSGQETQTGEKTKNSKDMEHSKYTKFRNVIIIMTSNIGAKKAQDLIHGKKTMSIGFASSSNTSNLNDFYESEMRKSFRPEFIGRINSIIHFSQLQKEDYYKVLDLQVEYQNNCNDIPIVLSNEVKEKIVSTSFGSENGTRELIHIFEKDILTTISKVLSNGSIKEAEERDFKKITILEIVLGEEGEYLVYPIYEKIPPKPKTTSSNRMLNNDEVVVSLFEGSLIQTLNNLIYPEIILLKTLYKERDNYSPNYAELIFKSEFKLKSWGLPQKDIDIIQENAYNELIIGVKEKYSYFEEFKVWSDLKSAKDIKIAKIARTYVYENIDLIIGGAGNREEFLKDLVVLIERELEINLKLKQITEITMFIEMEYQKRISKLPKKTEAPKALPAPTREQKNQGGNNSKENPNTTVNITINLNSPDFAEVLTANISQIEEVIKNNFKSDEDIDELAYLVLNELNNISGRSFSDFYLSSLKEKIREVLQTINPYNGHKKGLYHNGYGLLLLP